LATSEAALAQQLHTEASPEGAQLWRRIDVSLLAGIAIALGAAMLGLHFTGVSLGYFLQPAGAVIVLGGTLGVLLVTTPRNGLIHSVRRAIGLITSEEVDRGAVIEEIVHYARQARRSGIVSLELVLPKIHNPLLRHALEMAVDVSNRSELGSVLETELHMAERQGEADAKTLEVAGGFAPTLGIIGTVIGLIEVLRQFANISSVGYGIGTAFVSTIYGLALANLLLLPIAHRIRARTAENFETQELIMEGVLAIGDTVHPSVIRMRLVSFLRQPSGGHDAS
jgi:chemotaxis protein MotA